MLAPLREEEATRGERASETHIRLSMGISILDQLPALERVEAAERKSPLEPATHDMVSMEGSNRRLNMEAEIGRSSLVD